MWQNLRYYNGTCKKLYYIGTLKNKYCINIYNILYIYIKLWFYLGIVTVFEQIQWKYCGFLDMYFNTTFWISLGDFWFPNMSKNIFICLPLFGRKPNDSSICHICQPPRLLGLLRPVSTVLLPKPVLDVLPSRARGPSASVEWHG